MEKFESLRTKMSETELGIRQGWLGSLSLLLEVLDFSRDDEKN